LVSGLNLAPSSTTSLSDYYEDAANVPDYAVNAVAAASEKQMIANHPDFKKFNAEKFATRAEIAVFVYEALVEKGTIKDPFFPRNTQGTGKPQGPGATTNGVPNNNLKVIITHAVESDGRITPATDLDGKARTVGEEFTVSIKALDRLANDLSSIVTLEDSTGKPLGTGSNIVYQASEPKNECLTARVKVGEQQSWDTVCFTVSSRDIILQDDVKVFDRPEEAENLLAVDTGREFVCFTDDANLQKKIKPGDKLVPFFRPVPQRPTLMPGELITPPIKVGNRISVEEIYQDPSSLPGKTACFAAQEIFALTELVKKAETNYGQMPDFDFIGDFTEEDTNEEAPTGFSRVKDEENAILDDGNSDNESGVIDNNSNVLGFSDIKEGWPDGLDELIEGSELKDDKSTILASKSKIQEKLLVASLGLRNLFAQVDPNRFGSMEGEPLSKNLNSSYQYRVNLPLIDEPNGKRQTPGQSVGKRKKCSAFFSSQSTAPTKQTDREDMTTREEDKSFTMLGTLGLNANPRSNLPGLKKPSMKDVKLNIIVDAAKKLANIKFEGNPSISLLGGLSMEGSYPLLDCAETWTLLEKRLPVTVPLPPLPLWIAFYLHIPVNLEANLSASVDNAFLGLTLDAETGPVKMTFNTLTGLLSDVSWNKEKSKFRLKPIANGEASLDGKVRVSLEPTIKFLVNEAVGPGVALAAIVQGNAEAPKTKVSIEEPRSGATYGRANAMKLAASVRADVLPSIQFVQWYEAFIKLYAENETLAKFSEKFSVLQGGANQVCSTDAFKFPGSSGRLFGATSTSDNNDSVAFDIMPTQNLVDMSGNEEVLLAYQPSSVINTDQSLIALGKFKKPSWDSVKSVAGKVAEPVKAVGKKVQQGAKKTISKGREVVRQGKKITTKVIGTAQNLKDGFCSQTRNIRGTDIQKFLKEKLTVPAYRWPETYDQKKNIVCENGNDLKNVDPAKRGQICGEYKRFGFLPNKVIKYAKLLGTFSLPDAPAGFERTVWVLDGQVVNNKVVGGKVIGVKQSKRLGDATPPPLPLETCPFPVGQHKLIAATYGSFDYSQRKLLGYKEVDFTISKDCASPVSPGGGSPSTTQPPTNTLPGEVNLEVISQQIQLQQASCKTGCKVRVLDENTLAVDLPQSSFEKLSVSTGDRLISVDQITSSVGIVSIGGVNETVYIFAVPKRPNKYRVGVFTVRTEKNGTYQVPVFVTVK
jgi:hypothetical protein